MVKTILQTVQNQDRVLKDLYTHLRSFIHNFKHTHAQAQHCKIQHNVYSSLCDVFGFPPSVVFYSTILVCKQHIIDLFPKLERAVENIKTAEAAVMQMQMKRQREFWYLLKIACVSF